MKRKWKGALCCLAGGMAIVAILIFALGQSAEEPRETGPVRLSHQSGFYDDEFWLEMSSDGGEIHYTLDSTTPDENSPLYTGPIRIGDASANENVYSAITDVCLELEGDWLEEAEVTRTYGFTTPDKPVDKATVVRAVCIDAFGNRSEVTDGVYFVGFDKKPGYDGMNIIAVTTDPANLFDYERGIYVLGKTFGDALAEDDSALSSNPGNWPANYKNKGSEWEREASICFFNADRNLVLSGNYGIRVQGGASRYMLPKSLNIYARRRYGSPTIPAEELFGEDWQLTRLNLNSGAQGMATKIHDVLVNTLVSDMDVMTREYRPYELFLDGEYWGVYWLTPRYKEDYFENKYGVRLGDVIATKVDYIEVGYDEDFNRYKGLLRLIADNDLADPEKFDQVCEQIDLDSWIDYYAIEIYIANIDWPKNNRSIWRVREPDGGTYGDGKWRWVLFDVNMAMDPKNAEAEFVTRTESQDAIFASLMDNPGFESALYARLLRLARENFNPERVDAFVDQYVADMAGPMANEYARFTSGRTEQDFIDDCEAIKAFFRQRHDYIEETYSERQE